MKVRDKKALMALDKLMVLILVVLSIAIILMFVFRVDILKMIRNLPELAHPENDERVVDSSFLANQSYVQVGKIVVEKREASIFNQNYIYIGNTATDLYWPNDKKEGKVLLAIPFGNDMEIGEIKNYKIEFGKWLLFIDLNYQEFQRKYSSGNAPSLNDLKLTDGAEYFSGTLFKKMSDIDIEVSGKETETKITEESSAGAPNIDLKNEMEISPILKEQLLYSIKNNYRVYIELNTQNKKQPVVYVTNTQKSLFFLWDYEKKILVKLEMEPIIKYTKEITTLDKLKEVLGITEN